MYINGTDSASFITKGSRMFPHTDPEKLKYIVFKLESFNVILNVKLLTYSIEQSPS